MSRDETLSQVRTGTISPSIALARMALSGEVPDPAELASLAETDPALRPLADLAAGRGERLARLATLARSGMDPEGEDMVAATAALFDRLAKDAPEAGVAFYSLGDPELLQAATAELVGVVRDWTPVEGRRVLDLGCGIGRLSIAIAPHAAEVVGIDVSPGMVAEAEGRARGVARFAVANGRDLSSFADASLDLIVAADSFPYLVRAGIVDAQMAEIARVLAPGGDLLVFNWSYRGDPTADGDDVQRLAGANGMDVLRAGDRPFAIWDAAGFHLRKA